MSPARGLSSGEQVTVSGGYFHAGEQLSVQECRAGSSECGLFSSHPAAADGHGSFRTPFVVNDAIQLTSCRTTVCVIRVVRAGGGAVDVPISFG